VNDQGREEESGMTRTEEPWRSYAAAFVEVWLDERLYVLEPIEEAVPSAATPGETLPVRPVWIITAWNPHPNFFDREENERRGRALAAALDAEGVVHHSAVGRSPDWSAFEHSRAAIGTDRTMVLELAQRFEQLAVFEITDRIDCVAADGVVMTSRPYRLTERALTEGSEEPNWR